MAMIMSGLHIGGISIVIHGTPNPFLFFNPNAFFIHLKI